MEKNEDLLPRCAEITDDSTVAMDMPIPRWVTNGCADNMSGASEVPQPDPLCATRKSAEVGQKLSHRIASVSH
jgi:hypothetical protein